MTTITAKAPPIRAAAARPAGVTAGATIDPLKVVRRHLLLLVIVAILGGMLGFGAFLLCDRYMSRYTGRVGFEILPQLTDPLDPAARANEQGDAVLRAARTEAEYLTSLNVIQEMLKTKRDVREETDWGRRYVDANGNFAYDEATQDLLRSLDPVVGRDTNLFYLEWSAERAADVPVVLNAIADVYVKRRTAMEQEGYDKAIQEFENRILDLSKLISEQQAAVETFLRESHITATNDMRDSQLFSAATALLRQISEVDSSIGMQESLRQQIDEKLRGTVEFSQDDRRIAEDDPIVRNMTATLNQQRIALNAARERFGPNHLEVKSLEQLVKSAEAEREVAIRDRIERNLRSQLRESILQVERLERLRADLQEDYLEKEAQLKDTSALISDYKNQQRAIEQNEEQRAELQRVVRDMRLMKSRDDARRVRTVFPATTPRQKSFPNLKLFLPLGVFMAVAATLGLIFLRELLDQRVKSGSDLAVIPGARVLGTIPDLSDDPTRCERPEMVVMERPQSVLAESYRQAAVPLAKALAATESKVLLVVGGLPEAGTTTVISNLAAIDAAAGRRVLVIDGNFRRPSVHTALGVREDGPGLGDLLAGKATAEEAIVSAAEGLDVITAGTPATRIFERLNTTRLDALLAELRPRYDLILIDAPPAVVAGETMVLASKVDAVVLVVRANQEQRGLVARLIRQFADLRCEFLGVILNRPRGTAGGYFRKNYATIAEYARAT